MKYKILFVDDEISSLKAISAILENAGFEVIIAKTAEEGLAKLQVIIPHCILLDYRLPGMNGIEMLKWLKEKDYHIPIIILTAYGTIEKAVEAMKLGAFHYLVKPVDPELLVDVVKEAATKHSIALDISYEKNSQN